MGSAEKHIQEKGGGGGGGGDEEEAEEEEETSDFGLLGSSEDDSRIIEWEDGLPSADDLMPLSQPLITPELASAFSISPEPYRSSFDVNRASQNTIANLRRHHSAPSRVLKSLPPFHPDPTDETDNSVSESRKVRRLDADEADDSTPNDDHSAARTLKRPRLVWTPQLHKRFVDVVHHLGIKNAVPKTIMQLMNVEGLTRENVASHLQKYRLYLKRMQGLSTDGPSSSDPLFASTPIPQSFHEAGSVGGGAPMQYGAAQTMPMPVLGMPQGQGHLGPMPAMGNHPGAAAPNYHHGFVDSNPYNHMLIQQQQREWSGNQYGSIMSYNHMTSSNK